VGGQAERWVCEDRKVELVVGSLSARRECSSEALFALSVVRIKEAQEFPSPARRGVTLCRKLRLAIYPVDCLPARTATPARPLHTRGLGDRKR
jgi:hypothetical protein